MVYDFKSSQLNFFLITDNSNVIKQRELLYNLLKNDYQKYIFFYTLPFIFFYCLLYFKNNNFQK